MKTRFVTAFAFLTLLLLMLTVGHQTSLSASTERTETASPQVYNGSIPAAPQKAQPLDPIGFALDDGIPESASGFPKQRLEHERRSYLAEWVQCPASVPYPLTLTNVAIDYPDTSAGNFVGDPIQVLIYLDTDRDGNPSNAQLIYQSPATITVADWYTFQYFPINNLVVNTRGDLYVGWEDTWAEGGPSPREYIAATDETQPQHRSWIIGKTTCCTPNIANLAANDYRHRIDAFQPG